MSPLGDIAMRGWTELKSRTVVSGDAARRRCFPRRVVSLNTIPAGNLGTMKNIVSV